ncbi:hypothetical protein SMF913_14582 [Streptomyces malaysiensis]|uniref:Uncharacterized protein n=1 Tax=Streptomyces malaysiensis TaxID=92644 RepID=A0A2J7ZE72_STRMQ|nr:hypothetical protein SMF913_14582 [Streptomyces malaysiensis]
MVGVGVEPDDVVHLDGDAGLFHHLSDDGFGDGFSDVVAPSGEGPQVIIRLMNEQETSGLVLNHSGDRWYDGVRFGVVVVVDATHA